MHTVDKVPGGGRVFELSIKRVQYVTCSLLLVTTRHIHYPRP